MNKKYRVKKSEDFRLIMSKKKFVTNESFALYYRKNEQELFHVGISVGKKLGNAVRRNKIKRQVRMMIHELCTFNEPFDVILLVRKGYCEQNYEDNKKRLEKLLKKVKL